MHALQQRQHLPGRLLQRLHLPPDLLRGQAAVSRCRQPVPRARPARPAPTSRMSWSAVRTLCSAMNISLTDMMLPPPPATQASCALGGPFVQPARGLPRALPHRAAPGCPAQCLSGRMSQRTAEEAAQAGARGELLAPDGVSVFRCPLPVRRGGPGDAVAPPSRARAPLPGDGGALLRDGARRERGAADGSAVARRQRPAALRLRALAPRVLAE